MAARTSRGTKSNPWSEEHRARIKTSMLINRLQDNALSKTEIMTPGQIRSAEVLLKKAIPDLQAMQHSGDADNPIKHAHEIVIRIVDPKIRG